MDMNGHNVGTLPQGDPSHQHGLKSGLIYTETNSLQYSPRGGVLIC
jgi:hypothetical protein